jgi:tetratricopeptide (TPR) repeat protein
MCPQASIVKMSLCRCALEDFTEAYATLQEALSLSRGQAQSIADNRQLAEILNNLGCLSYMCGKVEEAKILFTESLETQTMVSEHSLYSGSRFSCQTASLNGSITKGNIGFLALVSRNLPVSITAFEFAVKVGDEEKMSCRVYVLRC